MNVKKISQTAMAALVAATFLVGGLAVLPTVQAADGADRPAIEQRHKINPEQMAEHIATTFSLNKDTVLQYYNNGTSFKDIRHAAFLAKAGNLSLDTVLQTKTDSNSWQDVAQTLKISPQQIKATRIDLQANHLTKTGLDKQAALDLLNQGYHPRDIACANQLSKDTGKSITDVLSYKKINNTWQDVATTLGVSPEQFKQEMKNLKGSFPHHGGFHHRGTDRIAY